MLESDWSNIELFNNVSYSLFCSFCLRRTVVLYPLFDGSHLLIFFSKINRVLSWISSIFSWNYQKSLNLKMGNFLLCLKISRVQIANLKSETQLHWNSKSLHTLLVFLNQSVYLTMQRSERRTWYRRNFSHPAEVFYNSSEVINDLTYWLGPKARFNRNYGQQ